MFTNIEDNEWHIVSAKDPTLPREASNHAEIGNDVYEACRLRQNEILKGIQPARRAYRFQSHLYAYEALQRLEDYERMVVISSKYLVYATR